MGSNGMGLALLNGKEIEISIVLLVIWPGQPNLTGGSPQGQEIANLCPAGLSKRRRKRRRLGIAMWPSGRRIRRAAQPGFRKYESPLRPL